MMAYSALLVLSPNHSWQAKRFVDSVVDICDNEAKPLDALFHPERAKEELVMSAKKGARNMVEAMTE